jgi:hypothetical protein
MIASVDIIASQYAKTKKSLDQAVTIHKTILPQNLIAIDDILRIYREQDRKQVIVSKKYYIKEADDASYIYIDKKQDVEISAIRTGIGNIEYPHCETNKTKRKQLISIRNFLINLKKEHALNPSIPFPNLLQARKKVLQGKAVNLQHFMSDIPDITQVEECFRNKIATIASELGAVIFYKGEIQSNSNTYFIFLKSTVNIDPTNGLYKCLNYKFILDCMYHLCLLPEEEYKVQFYSH